MTPLQRVEHRTELLLRRRCPECAETAPAGAILRGEKARADAPVATQVEGHAAIQIKERLLQYNKKTESSNQLSWDISQTGGVTAVLLKVGVLAVVAALFYLAFKVFN